VKAYNLKPGDYIELVRSGEVIPKFLSVVTSSGGDYNIPTHCPSCGTKLDFDDVRIKCSNHSSCPAQRSGGILNWIKAVNIEDLSEKRLQQMIDLSLVVCIPDLYKLTQDDLLKLPATKEKMAKKLFDNIQQTKTIPMAMFLNGLGIEGAGQTTWEKITEIFPNLGTLRSLTISDLIAIDGFAEKSASQIVAGLRRQSKLIDQLLAVGVVPELPIAIIDGPRPFEGMTFVITGALSQPRKNIEDLIKKAGGRIGSSVSKTTSVLVTNETDSASSKMLKAKDLGLDIWSEAKLMARLS
jgi:DNA ligase (NAD+)